MIEHWGQTSDGRDVKRITLRNADLTCNIITFGASIQDLRIEGHSAPLILGFNSIQDYETHRFYFGAIVGRFANRIAGGRFELGGSAHQLAVEDGDVHHLHGGPYGFFSEIWDIEGANESEVTLTLESLDGDMGYPANLMARCTYKLTADNAIEITLSAQTDAPTICNLVNHAYFNLEDGGAKDVDSHRVRIDADNYLIADETNAPTGQIGNVRGTKLDFLVLKPIGEFSAYDHNFCLSTERRALTAVAQVVAPKSGIQMDVFTTEAGLQFYGGNYIGSVRGLDRIDYKAGSGFCLEAQVWPDAPNHKDFPSAVLRPGENLEQKTVYRFKRAI